MKASIESAERRADGSIVHVVTVGHRTYLLVLRPAMSPDGSHVGYTPVIAPATYVPGSADVARDAGMRAIERITGVGGPRPALRREVLAHQTLPSAVNIV